MFNWNIHGAKMEAAESRAFAYPSPEPIRHELREIERCCARLFATEDGRKFLGYLQAITFQRALAPTAPDEQLRYIEGQRALVASILRLIDRGRQPG